MSQKLAKDIIKENKIYSINKAISALNDIFKMLKINNKMTKVKIIFLISKSLTPSEIFCFESVQKELLNTNSQNIFEEELIREPEEILIIEKSVYVKNLLIDIDKIDSNTKNKFQSSKILVGISNDWNTSKKNLENKIKKKLMEYENFQTILFERV